MSRRREFSALAARRTGRKPLPARAPLRLVALQQAARAITAHSDAHIRSLPQLALEDSWFFRWDATAPLDLNLYEFFDLLDLYARTCERWEHLHGGHVGLVERVRDRYVLPKIRWLLMTHLPRPTSDSIRSGMPERSCGSAPPSPTERISPCSSAT